jgi:hydroxyacylglutathione hydrolase
VLGSGGHVFSGDTLFCGGPGATGRSHSDYPLILQSIRTRLLTLPAETIVHTGHGDSTTVGAETPLITDLIHEVETAGD